MNIYLFIYLKSTTEGPKGRIIQQCTIWHSFTICLIGLYREKVIGSKSLHEIFDVIRVSLGGGLRSQSALV